MDGSDIVALAIVIPGDNLDEFRIYSKDMLPAIMPKRITAPGPGLAPVWQVGEKPWRDTHHECLGAHLGLPPEIGSSSHGSGTIGPHVPGKAAIDDITLCLDRGSTNRSPVRDEVNTIGNRGADRRPVGGIGGSFESRNKGSTVDLVVGAAAREGVEDADDIGFVPSSTRCVVEREDELEAGALSGFKGIFNGCGAVAVRNGNIEDKAVDTCGLCKLDITGPVTHGPTISVTDLVV